MKVMMIGAGYVGLTTGACLAELGHQVAIYDADARRMERLRMGDLPIYEPGLGDLVATSTLKGTLSFPTELQPALVGVDVVFVCVGTPSLPGGEVDLSQVQAATRSMAPHLGSDTVVVIKSTVEAGTARSISSVLATARGGRPVAVASNPEFLREGTAIADFLQADRIVVGADTERAAARLAALYAPLVRRGIPYVETSTVDAELTKCAANAFLALKIGFINEVSDLCEVAGADVGSVARAVGLDRRIGNECLRPGPGFGGSCFPKDIRSFVATGRRLGAAQRLIETLIDRNEHRKRQLAQRVLDQLGGSAGRKTVAVLGLAFKADTDDMREAAALTLIPLLQAAGVRVKAHDPQAMDRARGLLPGVIWCNSPYDAAQAADAIVVLTEWPEYRELDLARLSRMMRGKALFDFRNIIEPAAAALHGFAYAGLGRRALLNHVTMHEGRGRQDRAPAPGELGARDDAGPLSRRTAAPLGGGSGPLGLPPRSASSSSSSGEPPRLTPVRGRS